MGSMSEKALQRRLQLQFVEATRPRQEFGHPAGLLASRHHLHEERRELRAAEAGRERFALLQGLENRLWIHVPLGRQDQRFLNGEAHPICQRQSGGEARRHQVETHPAGQRQGRAAQRPNPEDQGQEQERAASQVGQQHNSARQPGDGLARGTDQLELARQQVGQPEDQQSQAEHQNKGRIGQSLAQLEAGCLGPLAVLSHSGQHGVEAAGGLPGSDHADVEAFEVRGQGDREGGTRVDPRGHLVQHGFEGSVLLVLGQSIQSSDQRESRAGHGRQRAQEHGDRARVGTSAQR